MKKTLLKFAGIGLYLSTPSSPEDISLLFSLSFFIYRNYASSEVIENWVSDSRKMEPVPLQMQLSMN